MPAEAEFPSTEYEFRRPVGQIGAFWGADWIRCLTRGVGTGDDNHHNLRSKGQERRHDFLVWGEDERLHCQTCGHAYESEDRPPDVAQS